MTLIQIGGGGGLWEGSPVRINARYGFFFFFFSRIVDLFIIIFFFKKHYDLSLATRGFLVELF